MRHKSLKRGLTNLNLEFPFPLMVDIQRLKCPLWPTISHSWRREKNWIHSFPKQSRPGLNSGHHDFYTHTHTHTHIYIYIYIRKTHTYTHMYTYIYIYIYVCVCVCVCVKYPKKMSWEWLNLKIHKSILVNPQECIIYYNCCIYW